MELTIVILAAGFGKRMGPFSRMVNKSLIPFNNRPLLSHIIEKFPKGSKFIVACGHNGEQVCAYVDEVHFDKNIRCVSVPNYNDISTGPATSLRECAKYIDGGFFCITCDTLFEFDYSDKLNENWIGVHPVNSDISKDYCWIVRDSNSIISIYNKEHSNSAVDAFTGLMYFKDKEYLDALESLDAKELYEGFTKVDLNAYTLSEWYDFGTYDKWKKLNESSSTLSLPKPDELFYSDNGKIIKYTSDDNLAHRRYLRAIINPDCMPDNVVHNGNFLFYDREEGETFYNNLNIENFKLFLDWVKSSIWIAGNSKNADIRGSAFRFYKTKTDERLALFRAKYNTWEELSTVNDTPVDSIGSYLSTVDFDWLAETTEWAFIHGDMQFENIIFNPETEKFTAIDWRTDFAGDYYGDIYYDLAKLLGGLYLSYKDLREGKLEYNETNSGAIIKLLPVDDVDEYVSILKEFVKNLDLDWDKVATLVPIIYLNMSPLHEEPLDKYLIALSQLYFSRLWNSSLE